MTITATSGAAQVEPAVAAPVRSRALAVRRGFLIASPVLAGLFAVIGAAADPGAAISGEKLFALYAENPGPLQIKSLAFHWSYAFWIGTALMVAPYVRRKGVWIANIAALLGFAGMTTLPGMLAMDWFDSSLAQLYGVEAVTRVHEHMETTMWGVPFFLTPGIAGLMLALPLAAVALWRAGLVRWWAFAAVVVAFVAFMASGITWWGCLVTTAFLAVFSVALARGTRSDTTA